MSLVYVGKYAPLYQCLSDLDPKKSHVDMLSKRGFDGLKVLFWILLNKTGCEYSIEVFHRDTSIEHPNV